MKSSDEFSKIFGTAVFMLAGTMAGSRVCTVETTFQAIVVTVVSMACWIFSIDMILRMAHHTEMDSISEENQNKKD